MKRILDADEVNTSRLIEFDMAKVLSIIIMIFTHGFEELHYVTNIDPNHPLYYLIVNVLEILFCANVFMGSMGFGIAYGRRTDAESIIRRGFRIFCAAYVLNIFRYMIPYILPVALGVYELNDVIIWLTSNDILQFAGIALMFFGLLKKLKCSDLTMLLISLGMSIIGSIVRFIDLGNLFLNQFAGLFIGTYDPVLEDDTACFPLFNWFIIVVITYLYAKKLRHCSNTDRFYAITLPVSGVIVGLYAAYAIPNRFGMLSGNLVYFYNFSTPNVLILFSGIVFITSVCYFAAKLLSEKWKKTIIRISTNLTPIYIIHWEFISLTYIIVECFALEYINILFVSIVSVSVCTVSIILGCHCPEKIRKLLS